ncbi:MAG: AMP-binding protein, partial [bacterium]|nr:AMP-binding protein [bacterium]
LKGNFHDAKMANVYGQTECSVACINIITADDPFDKLMLGEPLDETEIFLVDEDDEIVEDMGAGEIVISCDYIATGYWRDPENTKDKFTYDPDEGRLYWTGDLGAVSGTGAIEMMGRKDFQVKIRGFRVEVGEIETAILGYKTVDEAVVMVKMKEGNEPFLCAYIVCASPPDMDALREYLLEEIPDYMVPSYFEVLEAMPLTPNGKTDRKALPEPQLHGMGIEYVAPRDDVEHKLAEIWAGVLAQDVEEIGIDADFFELGGHSLKAVTVSLVIHKELHVKLQLPVMFSHTTIRKLGDYIKTAEKDAFVAIPRAEDKPCYRLSSAQKRMYILNQAEKENTAYNIYKVIMA